MSLRPGPVPPVPDETARVARAAFPGSNLNLRMRDELDTIFEDAQFSSLFPCRGRPVEAPWRLALVTMFQFAEGLSDRQSAAAASNDLRVADWLAGTPRATTRPSPFAILMSPQ
jgi:transposase